MTPLHSASYNGHSEVFKFLINCKADLGAKTYLGHTAIHLACIKGHLEIVKQYAILTRKEDRAKGDASGKYPIHFAAEKGFDEVNTLNISYNNMTKPGTLGDRSKPMTIQFDYNANVDYRCQLCCRWPKLNRV
jgi:ankyrin repeat protein